MKNLLKICIVTLNFILFWISKFFPKKNNVWLFGAWMGNKYADNSKYLFEYINKYHPTIKIVWIANNQNIIDELRDKGFTVCKKYSLRSIYWGLQASCSIFTHSNSSDVMPFLNNGKTKQIQLWHGMPFKKIGFDDTKFTYKKRSLLKEKIISIFFPFYIESYDVVTASSIEDKEKFITAFKTNNVYITGYSRNDILARHIKNNSYKELVVTYLPTFRDNVGANVDFFSYNNFDLEKWEKFLKNENVKLKIKMHPVNKPNNEVLKLLGSIDNIEFLEEIDITSYLNKTDILITDYSSVYFDYLLTEKPIIFFPFDYQQYLSKDREFYYAYNEVTPGPECYDWDMVLEWINKLKKEPSLYLNDRIEISHKFHKYNDNNNNHRIFNLINSIIK